MGADNRGVIRIIKYLMRQELGILNPHQPDANSVKTHQTDARREDRSNENPFKPLDL